MRRSVANGLHCSIWDEDENEKGQRNFARAIRYVMTAGSECGHLCPVTMTNASVAALMAAPDVLKQWLPQITSRICGVCPLAHHMAAAKAGDAVYHGAILGIEYLR